MRTTYSTQTINGVPVGVPNETTDETGYYVSYNNYDTVIYGGDTTAIVVSNPTNFLILNGDHRQNLKDLSRMDAVAYFHANSELKNHMSDPCENYVFKPAS